VKPFLLLGIRAEDAAADNEYDSFLSLSGLGDRELRRVRLEQHALGSVDLDDWSGILLGGGPFNYSDPEELKTPVQRRVEADLAGLLDQVVSADFPFLGACYGIGALGRHQGAVVDRRFAEPVGAVEITLTPAGRQDPLLSELPAAFEAFTGHKEAVSKLPGHAVLLARSAGCPVQAFRVGANVYATQFHPELDVACTPGSGSTSTPATSTLARPTRSRRGPPAAMSPGRRRSCAGSSGATVSACRPGLRPDSPAAALVAMLSPLARRERWR
jgi:GMP synthase (glutamine-hydrolysing)